jgi:hypothetical protein
VIRKPERAVYACPEMQVLIDNPFDWLLLCVAFFLNKHYHQKQENQEDLYFAKG